MKKIKMDIIFIFIFIFFIETILTSCSGIIVREKSYERATAPYETLAGAPETREVRATAPYEVKKEFLPEQVEILSEVPAGTYPQIRLGANPVRPVSKNTVAALEDESRRTGQTIFVSTQPLLARVGDKNGKWVSGWLPAGTIFLATVKEDSRTGTKEYTLNRVARCWNPVAGLKVQVYPATLKVTERYRDQIFTTSTNTERYRDTRVLVDYTPAIWAGIAGLVVGGVIGFLIAPGKAAAQAVVAPALFKGPGAPAF